jgi:hypothetical protein
VKRQKKGSTGSNLRLLSPASHTVEPSVGARFDLFED